MARQSALPLLAALLLAAQPAAVRDAGAQQAAAPQPAAPQPSTPQAAAPEAGAEEIVTGLRAVAGNPAGVRASNAKGICASGTFTPAAEAAGLSKAPIFAAPTPITARFGMGGGNPRIADSVKAATRSLSMRFDYGAGETSLLLISTPMFVAKTPVQMLAFLDARRPGPDGQPDAAKVRAFSAANPETTRQAAWLNGHPAPASVAGSNYWAVTVYTLTNAAGQAVKVKFKAVPAAGELTLTDDELKAKPANFYADELGGRLAGGPALFDLVAIIGQPGDDATDSTAVWPEDSRRTVKLGTVAIKAAVPDATCNAFTFDPTVVPAGMAGQADDPMFDIRSAAYAISFSQRMQ